MRIKRKLFLSTAFAALLGVGVFAGVASQKEASKVSVVEAASTIDIYCTISFDYLNQDYIGVHQWGGSTPGTTWGSFTPMSKVFDNENGEPVFKLAIPSDRTGLIFIAYQGSGLKQTVDVESNIKNNQGWYFSGWSGSNMTVGTWTVKPYTINYNGNGSTSGSMPSEIGYANVGWGLTQNSFTKTNYVFSGWNTKADGTGSSYSDRAIVAKDSVAAGSTLSLYAQWTKYYETGRYVVGDFGDCDWGMEGAVRLPNTGSQYEGQVQLEFGDVFKIAYYNGSALSSYFGYSWILESCGAYHYFSGDGDSDITCYARGTYNIYFTDSEYASGKKISIELQGSLNAEHLAAKLMGMGENPGHCGDEDRFPAMRTVYLGLSAAEQAIFQGYSSSATAQFKNAYDRYTAWARALGENPWANAKANSRIVLSSIAGENASSTLIIIAISAVSLAVVGGYFLFRKKKEN